MHLYVADFISIHANNKGNKLPGQESVKGPVLQITRSRRYFFLACLLLLNGLSLFLLCCMEVSSWASILPQECYPQHIKLVPLDNMATSVSLLMFVSKDIPVFTGNVPFVLICYCISFLVCVLMIRNKMEAA